MTKTEKEEEEGRNGKAVDKKNKLHLLQMRD